MSEEEQDAEQLLTQIGDGILGARSVEVKSKGWKLYSEFLDDDQYIVNVEAVAEDGSPTTFSGVDEVIEADNYGYEVAQAICDAFNKATDKSERDCDDGHWYVHSETNLWDADGEETSEDGEWGDCKVSTVQQCIFQYLD